MLNANLIFTTYAEPTHMKYPIRFKIGLMICIAWLAVYCSLGLIKPSDPVQLDTKVDYGTIDQHSTTSKLVRFSNTSPVPVPFSIVPDCSCQSFFPPSGVIPPLGSIDVTANFKPKESRDQLTSVAYHRQNVYGVVRYEVYGAEKSKKIKVFANVFEPLIVEERNLRMEANAFDSASFSVPFLKASDVEKYKLAAIPDWVSQASISPTAIDFTVKPQLQLGMLRGEFCFTCETTRDNETSFRLPIELHVTSPFLLQPAIITISKQAPSHIVRLIPISKIKSVRLIEIRSMDSRVRAQKLSDDTYRAVYQSVGDNHTGKPSAGEVEVFVEVQAADYPATQIKLNQFWNFVD